MSIKVGFLDRLEKSNQKGINRFEDYFEPLSKLHRGKVYRLISPNAIQRVEKQRRYLTVKAKVEATFKCLSYLTLILPIAMLIGRAVRRARCSFQIRQIGNQPIVTPQVADLKVIDPIGNQPIVTPQVADLKVIDPAEIAAAQQRMDNRWKRYKKEAAFFKDPLYFDPLFTFARSECTLPLPVMSLVHPDPRLVQLPKRFENNHEAHFIPALNSIAGRNDEEIQPATTQGMEHLVSNVRDAFLLGKKTVVGCLGDQIHAVAFACQNDGSFKIIDSMMERTVDYRAIENALNQAQIVDSQGKKIQFRGEYVTTMLQNGGNHCFRFASLYAYHIAKTNDLNAYQQVNRAFYEGRLATFEDIDHIGQGQPMAVMPASWQQHRYLGFMLSWAMRSWGYLENDWRDVSAKICLRLDPDESGPLRVFAFKNNKVPQFCDNLAAPGETDLYLIYPDGTERLINDIGSVPQELVRLSFDPNQQTIGDLYPKGNGMNFLLFEKLTNRTQMYALTPGYRLERGGYDPKDRQVIAS